MSQGFAEIQVNAHCMNSKLCLKIDFKYLHNLEVKESNESDIDLLEAKLEKVRHLIHLILPGKLKHMLIECNLKSECYCLVNVSDYPIYNLILIKLCSGMVDTGKSYLNAKSLFINGIWELSGYFKDDKFMVNTLNKLIQALTEMLKYQSILVDQAQRAICKNLSNYVKSDIKSVKETKKCFEKISDDFDNVLIRNSQFPRSKPAEYEDHNNTLTAVRSCFQHTGLDYISQISLLQSRKRHEITDTYFHQGSDLFQDVDPYLKGLGTSLTNMRDETAALEKQMESRHQLVNDFRESSVLSVPECRQKQGVVEEGYLFKRTTNAFKTWNRRWFMILNNQFVYRKRCKDDTLTVMEEDLKLCTVKPYQEIDRRHCFEVLSPTKSHVLQADSEEQCQNWMTSILNGINDAIQTVGLENDDMKESSNSQQSSPDLASRQFGDFFSNNLSNVSNTSLELSVKTATPSPKPRRIVSTILSLPGNEVCCDCKCEQPQWASINLGITLCIECSGIHRSMGVHVSKVRSLTLDAWDPETLKVMLELGNTVVNKIYEANVGNDAIRATSDCSREVREAWSKAKYVAKKFVDKLPQGTNHNNNKMITEEKKIVRKWSVRKVNRRKNNKICNKDTISDEKKSEFASDVGAPEIPNGVIVIGDDLIDDHCIIDNLGLDSADESPDLENEDDGNVGETTVLEDIEKLHPNLLLYRAASVHNLPVMCQAIANGADTNWINEEDFSRRPLHQAILSGSFKACEYLMLNGSKCKVHDKNMQTPLHLATEFGHTGQVCLFLKRGIDQHSLDINGKDALAIAVDKANADIVTLLRLGRLNEEMKDNDCSNPGDETFNEVVKDFTQIASNNPEKLKRLPSIS
ncbi:Arf-GAP with coiled-coil, ANK repeat and PH domain-containing protein 2 [Nymphon striatum]|nr:Arf-GAP with coiled-coil, ANK repeat and PH domain-containing protein 2 [Nymphon striatum]